MIPGPLVLEALGQAGGWLLLLSTDLRRYGALVSIGGFEVLAPVRPGEELELEAILDSVGDERWVMSGRVLAAGGPVLTARELMCVLIDAGELEDPGSLRRRRSRVLAAPG
ncbi:MAG: 3-hydroxylacyl-ACP dehydratase [Chloroflexota bacterium]